MRVGNTLLPPGEDRTTIFLSSTHIEMGVEDTDTMAHLHLPKCLLGTFRVRKSSHKAESRR